MALSQNQVLKGHCNNFHMKVCSHVVGSSTAYVKKRSVKAFFVAPEEVACDLKNLQ